MIGLLLAIVVSAGVCAGAYYIFKRRRIEKKIEAMKNDPRLQEQLNLFKSHMDSAQQELDRLKTQATKNPYVESQKKKHRDFRSSQPSPASSDDDTQRRNNDALTTAVVLNSFTDTSSSSSYSDSSGCSSDSSSSSSDSGSSGGGDCGGGSSD